MFYRGVAQNPPPPNPLPPGEGELPNQTNLMEFIASAHTIYSGRESQPDSPIFLILAGGAASSTRPPNLAFFAHAVILKG